MPYGTCMQEVVCPYVRHGSSPASLRYRVQVSPGQYRSISVVKTYDKGPVFMQSTCNRYHSQSSANRLPRQNPSCVPQPWPQSPSFCPKVDNRPNRPRYAQGHNERQLEAPAPEEYQRSKKNARDHRLLNRVIISLHASSGHTPSSGMRRRVWPLPVSRLERSLAAAGLHRHVVQRGKGEG